MNILSFIVLILLSLVGYSSGTVLKGGKASEIKPRIFDLLIILAIWSGAIYSRLTFSINKWLLVAIWLGISFALGIIIVFFRKTENKKKAESPGTVLSPSRPLKRLWKKWQDFSLRMGVFQSRVLLSFFYFIFLTPISLIIKLISDPLNIKHRSQGASGSFWLTKEAISSEIADFRRQF
jgi:hypothetical protein